MDGEVERNAEEPEPKSGSLGRRSQLGYPEPERWEESPTSAGLSSVTSASQARYGDPDQTLIFLDWDDTLFPTTELFDRWQVPSKPHLWDEVQFAAEQDAALEVWRAALYEHLCTAASLSKRVVIVTNSHRPWVSECAARFAPNILPLLEDIRVVYAREHMPQNPKLRSVMQRDLVKELPECIAQAATNAKFAVMKKETREFYSQYEGQTWKNIVSIGDMAFERDALKELTFTRKSPARELIRTKTWKVSAEPSIGRMIVSLKRRTIFLPAVIRFNGDFDVTCVKSLIENKRVLLDALNIRHDVQDDAESELDCSAASLPDIEKLLGDLEGLVQGDLDALLCDLEAGRQIS